MGSCLKWFPTSQQTAAFNKTTRSYTMNPSTFSLKNFSATTALSALAFIGTTALSTTSVITTAAVLSMTHSSTAQAALICRDEPINTRGSKSRYFKYQPMKKSGVFGKCKKAGGVKRIKMLVPSLPSGVKRVGASRMSRADGCSGGGTRGRILFHAACNAHDICYASPGASKFKCEDMFLQNMLKIAKHGPIGSRVKALAFTTATGVVAHSSYNNGQVFAKRNYK